MHIYKKVLEIRERERDSNPYQMLLRLDSPNLCFQKCLQLYKS